MSDSTDLTHLSASLVIRWPSQSIVRLARSSSSSAQAASSDEKSAKRRRNEGCVMVENVVLRAVTFSECQLIYGTLTKFEALKKQSSDLVAKGRKFVEFDVAEEEIYLTEHPKVL